MIIPNLNELNLAFQSISKVFITNSIRKNYFLAVCWCINNNADLMEIDTVATYGGNIGAGDSYLEPLLNSIKIIRLHAVIHDACGFMKTMYDIGPGYCYLSPIRCPNSCYLGHISGILFCVSLKLFSREYQSVIC